VREDRFGTAGVHGGNAGRHEMQRTSSRGEILEIIVFAIASFLLSNLGTWILFFLVPLQMIYARRGQRALILCAATSFALLLLFSAYEFIFKSSRDAVSALLTAASLVPIFSLLAGIVILNLAALGRLRATVRLIVGSLVAGFCTLILYLGAMLFAEFPNAILAIFTDFSDLLQGLLTRLDAETASALSVLFEPAAMMKVFIEYSLRTYIFLYFLIIAIAWFIGDAIASRMYAPERRAERPRLSTFRLESWFLWPLIAAGALILVDRLVPITIVSAVAWNAGLIVWFLFGMQGLAIVKFIFEKHRLPRILWTLVVVGICMLLLRADLNIVLIIAIPAFGVSENWIRYRIPWDPKADDFGKE
jgi:hypothetical protein